MVRVPLLRKETTLYVLIHWPGVPAGYSWSGCGLQQKDRGYRRKWQQVGGMESRGCPFGTAMVLLLVRRWPIPGKFLAARTNRAAEIEVPVVLVG